MNNIKYIDIVTENLEVIRINRNEIGVFHIHNIQRCISRLASNYITDYLSAEEVLIQISPNANTELSFISNIEDNQLPFDRIIKHSDITHIDVIYEDGKNEYISVPWGGESDYENPYQSVTINGHNNDLYLAISEKNDVHQIFKDEIKQKYSRWDMYE